MAAIVPTMTTTYLPIITTTITPTTTVTWTPVYVRETVIIVSNTHAGSSSSLWKYCEPWLRWTISVMAWSILIFVFSAFVRFISTQGEVAQREVAQYSERQLDSDSEGEESESESDDTDSEVVVIENAAKGERGL